MKRIFLTLAVIATMFLSACNLFTKEETVEKESINSTDNFNELVWKINEKVMEDYPTVGFYEAFANLAEYDSTNYGVIDPFTMVVVYGDTELPRTVMATVDTNWIVQCEVIEDLWMEDQFTTPYVPMDLELALELIQNETGTVYGAGTIAVLRHQLYYKEPEPRYFIGSIQALHTANVYTGEVDAQLSEIMDHVSTYVLYETADTNVCIDEQKDTTNVWFDTTNVK